MEYVKRLASEFPDDLPTAQTAWRLRCGLHSVCHAANAVDPAAHFRDGFDFRFPPELQPFAHILDGAGVQDEAMLYEDTPYEGIGMYADFLSQWEGTAQLVPDITSHFILVHALRVAYRQAGHCPKE